MPAAPLHFHSLRIIRDRLDPQTRRTVRVEPQAVLFLLPEGQAKFREVHLTNRQLRTLLAAAADANLRLDP